MDTSLHVEAPPRLGRRGSFKVAGLGQCSLDFIAFTDGYPEEDTKKEASGMVIEGGGPVATALVSLCRLGVGTVFIGMVSDDWAGKEIKRGLIREGVDTAGLKARKGGRSQTAFITVNTGTGSRTICWMRPTVAALAPGEVRASLIRGAGFLLLDGLMADASMKAAGVARKLGIPVMLDAGRLREGMIELASVSDYVVASEEFSRGLGLNPEKALRKLSGAKTRAATVTLGDRGSLTLSGGRTFFTKAFRIKAVDTTGAGDVFHGGYIYGLLKGWPIEKTVEFASAFAALKCLERGSRAGIPTLHKTLKFMRNGR